MNLDDSLQEQIYLRVILFSLGTTRSLIFSRKNAILCFVSTPYPPFKNLMKIFMKMFCLSFSFRDMDVNSFAFLSMASIIVQLETR